MNNTKLDRDWRSVVSALKKIGLTLTQTGYTNENTEIMYGEAEYNCRNFKVQLWPGSFFFDVEPKANFREFVPYPEELPKPDMIKFHYDASDLTQVIRQALKEIGGKTIYQHEVIDGDTIHSDEIHYTPKSNRPVEPFMKFQYQLQKPSEEYSECILPVDYGTIDEIMLPYHKPQREHLCIPDDVTEFPFLPINLEKYNIGLDLEVEFGNMEPDRVRDIFAGMPLPLNTTISFGPLQIIEGEYTMYLMMYDKNRQFNRGNQRFQFNHHAQNLQQGISEIVPYFLQFHDNFIKST